MNTTDTERLLQEFGERLGHMRLDRNWSQAHLATEAGVSIATLRRLESGHSIALGSWLRVLDVLGLGERLHLVIPPPAEDPLAAALRERQSEKGRRKRASANRDTAVEGDWSWGEDQ